MIRKLRGYLLLNASDGTVLNRTKYLTDLWTATAGALSCKATELLAALTELLHPPQYFVLSKIHDSWNLKNFALVVYDQHERKTCDQTNTKSFLIFPPSSLSPCLSFHYRKNIHDSWAKMTNKKSVCHTKTKSSCLIFISKVWENNACFTISLWIFLTWMNYIILIYQRNFGNEFNINHFFNA